MREIEFRGKQITTGKWLYGDLMHDSEKGCYIYPIDAEGLYKKNKVIPETVGQYTGQKDRNGKKIYEGDIIKGINLTEFVGVVEYDEVNPCFCIKIKDYCTPEYDFVKCGNMELEVIGNVHDNFTLMK